MTPIEDTYAFSQSSPQYHRSTPLGDLEVIAKATLSQKLLFGLASTGLVGFVGLVLANTTKIAEHNVRIEATEKMEAKIDKLNDQLSVTNANIAALNAHLEDVSHDHKGH